MEEEEEDAEPRVEELCKVFLVDTGVTLEVNILKTWLSANWSSWRGCPSRL